MPDGWGTVRLRDAGTWLSGGTPRTSTAEYWGGDIPWISSKSLTDFRVRDADRRVTALGAANGTRLVPAETILMVVRGMSLKTEFRMGITQRQVAFGQDCKALIAKDGIDPVYLAYALSERSDDILDLVDEAGHGTGRLQMDLLGNVEIPLPPIGEQRAIAAAVGLLDDKLESIGRAIDTALLVAQELLSDGDESKMVREFATLEKGLSYKGAGLVDHGHEKAVPMVNLANFTTRGWLKAGGLKYYTGDYKPRHVLRAGDLVLANTDLTQNRIILGRGLLIGPTLEEAITSHHTSVVRFPGDASLKLFLWAQLQSPGFRERAEGYATGTTVTALPAEAVLDFPVRFPSNDAERSKTVAAANDLFSRVWALEDEARAVGCFRHEFLPQLLGGRVTVPLEALT